jgi:hypothetical protein
MASFNPHVAADAWHGFRLHFIRTAEAAVQVGCDHADIFLAIETSS